MKTLKPIYMLALTAAFALAACSKDDSTDTPPPAPEPTLTVGQTEYTLDAAEERTATVAFTAVADWTLSVVYDDAESSADWLSVTPASGTAGEQTVELSTTRNFRASARTAYADLACGEQSVRLTVTQTAASGDTDFTARFDEAFAKELQKQDIIADAEHITPEDMEKIATITRLNVSGTYENRGTLTSLQGIEYFESLTYLNCDYNQLTELDVSRYTALTDLWCSYNQLTELDVSQNTALTDLGCSSNQLTALDVSRNTELTYFMCFNNQLTALDVSRNTELTILGCNTNQLTELDVSANTKLETLWCDYNQLTELDLSRNTELTELRCEYNPGDGVSSFPITAWFDNETVPAGLDVYSSSWRYDGKTISIDFRKAE